MMVGHGESVSLRNKAAHFVSDLTTVLLNPISDQSSNSAVELAYVEGWTPAPVEGNVMEIMFRELPKGLVPHLWRMCLKANSARYN